jgi:translation elongation factor EF-Tu-like GTPase
MNNDATLLAIKKIRYANDTFPKDTEFLYECLGRRSNRTVRAAAVQTLKYLQDRYEGAQILLWHRFVDIALDLPQGKEFYMYVLDVFGIKGKSTCVSGYLSDGTIKPGLDLILEKADGRDIEIVCEDVINPYSSTIEKGSFVQVFIRNVTMGEVSQGDIIRIAS